MIPRVENTPEEKSWQKKPVKGSHVFCISGVCDHKVSLIRHSPCTLKRGFIWCQQHHGAPSVLAQKYCSEKAAKERWCSAAFLTNKRLTFAVLHVEHCTLYFCQRVPLTFTRNSCLRAPERMTRGRRLPKIGCLFISYVQSFTRCSLYLNIYKYFSWAACLKQNVALPRIITRNCNNIWTSIWHM